MDYSDIIYISEELGNSLSRTQVSAGDIVISQRGSLGQCAIVDDTFPKLFDIAGLGVIVNLQAELRHDRRDIGDKAVRTHQQAHACQLGHALEEHKIRAAEVVQAAQEVAELTARILIPHNRRTY